MFLREDAYYLINPGTVGRPLTADLRATYFLFDVARQAIAVHRVQSTTPPQAGRNPEPQGCWSALPFFHRASRTPLKWGAQALGVYDRMKQSGW